MHTNALGAGYSMYVTISGFMVVALYVLTSVGVATCALCINAIQMHCIDI